MHALGTKRNLCPKKIPVALNLNADVLHMNNLKIEIFVCRLLLLLFACGLLHDENKKNFNNKKKTHRDTVNLIHQLRVC